MTAERLMAAQKTAEAHAKIDEDVKQVYLLEASEEEENDAEEPIKLLEVVEGTLEVGVEPIGFRPNPERGQQYPLTIVEISPREFASMGNTIYFQDKVWRVSQALLPQPAGV
jgi:hypothetical protein